LTFLSYRLQEHSDKYVQPEFSGVTGALNEILDSYLNVPGLPPTSSHANSGKDEKVFYNNIKQALRDTLTDA
jgi:hypothetical protein